MQAALISPELQEAGLPLQLLLSRVLQDAGAQGQIPDWHLRQRDEWY